jgi:hypothetical protein
MMGKMFTSWQNTGSASNGSEGYALQDLPIQAPVVKNPEAVL